MFFKEKRKSFKNRISHSKYSSIDFDNLSDEEFNKIRKDLNKDISIRGIGGITLLMLCIVLVKILCSK